MGFRKLVLDNDGGKDGFGGGSGEAEEGCWVGGVFEGEGCRSTTERPKINHANYATPPFSSIHLFLSPISISVRCLSLQPCSQILL